MEAPPQNRHSGACCPRTYPSNTTSPKVDQSLWDLLLTTRRPPAPTRVSGQHYPTYQGTLDGGMPLTGPPSGVFLDAADSDTPIGQP